MKSKNLLLTFSGIILLLLHLINYYYDFMSIKLSYSFAIGSLFCYFGLLQYFIKLKK